MSKSELILELIKGYADGLTVRQLRQKIDESWYFSLPDQINDRTKEISNACQNLKMKGLVKSVDLEGNGVMRWVATDQADHKEDSHIPSAEHTESKGDDPDIQMRNGIPDDMPSKEPATTSRLPYKYEFDSLQIGIEQIIVYRTSDGKTHKTIEDAYIYAGMMMLNRLLEPIQLNDKLCNPVKFALIKHLRPND